MAQAYTPGLEVTPHTRITRLRELPIAGKALVRRGESVSAQTAVLEASLPGELDIVRVADRLGVEPEQILNGMKVRVGDSVQEGDVLCELKSFFGWFTSQVTAPVDGVIEFFTEANGHIGLRRASQPLFVNAYIDGVVSAVEETKSITVETDATFIQGIFGVGGERQGEIFCLPSPVDKMISAADISSYTGQLAGKIVVGGAAFQLDALKLLEKEKAQALVTGSIDASTLRGFVGFDIGVSITGDEKVPFTLIITEGFGFLPLSDRVFQLCKQLSGRSASVNGATQVRAGAMRPEVIVPGALTKDLSANSASPSQKVLEVGSRVRIIRIPYFGKFGKIIELPHEPVRVESGAVVRIVVVELEDANLSKILVPRANIELA